MENEEQAREETGETRFGNVFGTRTNTFYALFSLLKHIFHTQLPAIDVVSSTLGFELNHSLRFRVLRFAIRVLGCRVTK
jgi:hypothetical protein